MLTLLVFNSTSRDYIIFCFLFSFCRSGQHLTPDVSLVILESFVPRLITLNWLTQRQHRRTVIRSFKTFCKLRALQSFPTSVKSIRLYIAYSVTQKRAFGTIVNHFSSLKHAHQLAGYELTWNPDYHFQLYSTWGKTFLRAGRFRKSAITPSILHAAFDSFNYSILCMWLCGLCF